jgi:hypothetical protein
MTGLNTWDCLSPGTRTHRDFQCRAQLPVFWDTELWLCKQPEYVCIDTLSVRAVPLAERTLSVSCSSAGIPDCYTASLPTSGQSFE